MSAVASTLAIQLLIISSPAILAGIVWLGVQISAYIRAHTKNATLQGVLVRLNDTVITLVKEAEQTAVAELDAGEDKTKVRDDVVAKFKALWGPVGLKALMKVLGLTEEEQVTTLVTSKVEAAVHDLRLTQASLAKAGISVPG